MAEVRFIDLNRAIWGYETTSEDAGFWERLFGSIRRMYADYRVQGFETPGAIISAALPLLFSLAGLILFIMLIWGSMEIFLGAASPKSAEQGKKRITSALIGFILLFSSFWIAQIISQIFGLNIGLATS